MNGRNEYCSTDSQRAGSPHPFRQRRNIMSIELPRTKWKVFFDNLSRDFSNWETSVQVMNGDIGAQMMSEGLEFSGMTFEEREERSTIEVILDNGPDGHQSHNIFRPTAVVFSSEGAGWSFGYRGRIRNKNIDQIYPTIYAFSRVCQIGNGRDRVTHRTAGGYVIVIQSQSHRFRSAYQ